MRQVLSSDCGYSLPSKAAENIGNQRDSGHYFGFFRTAQVAQTVHASLHQLLVPGGGTVSQPITAVVLALAVAITMGPTYSRAQAPQSTTSQNDEMVRRAKSKVQPAYPELAHKMNISGTVKIEVTVAPNGTVKDARVVGGHPVLATAALDAAKRWRFEPAAAESSGIIDFKFEPR
jgi:TonB family protein